MSYIEIQKHSPEWAVEFENEKENLLSNILIDGMVVHHIGSTAINDLAAKPIIDILIEVPEIKSIDRFVGEFEILGYQAMGEYGIPERRYYRKGKEKRTHHIHTFAAHTHNVVRHLAFRDYLVSHPHIAKAYQSVKISAAELCDGNSAKYCELKNDFVVYYENLAVRWAEKA